MSRKSSKSGKAKNNTVKQTFCSFCGGGDYGESCLHPDKKKNGDVDMLELLEEGDIDMQEITFNSAAKVARLQHLDALEADKPVRAATEVFRRPAYAYTGLCPDAKWRGVRDNGKE